MDGGIARARSWNSRTPDPPPAYGDDGTDQWANGDARQDSTEETRLLGAGAHGDVQDARESSWGADFAGLSWWNTPSVYWLVGPFFLFTLAFGGVIVPRLNLIIELVCRDHYADERFIDPNITIAPVVLGGDNPQCMAPEVQKVVAKFTLVLNLVTGLLSAFVAPKMGQLSDRYGRTKLMGLASCGGVAAEIITILAAKYPDTIHYNWMIMGSFCDGLVGSFTAGTVLSHSYASDCTPPSRRGVAIGYLHACLFSGLAFGPLLAAYFIELTGSILSIFYVTLGCHIFFIVFVAFVIPESLSKKRQRAAREKYATELASQPRVAASWLESVQAKNPLRSLKILRPTGPGSSPMLRRNLFALALIDMVLLGAVMGGGMVIILYSEYMWGWKNLESSQFVSLVSTVRALILMIIFPVLNYFLRTRPAARRLRETGVPVVEKNAGPDELDIWLIRSALLSDVVGVTGYILAKSPAVFVMSGVVTALGGLGSATIQASLSKHVPIEKVGELLGAVGLLHALARVLAPILFNGLYAATVDRYPQAFFLLLAGFFAISLVASFFVRPHVYLKESETISPRSHSRSRAPAPPDTSEEEILI